MHTLSPNSTKPPREKTNGRLTGPSRMQIARRLQGRLALAHFKTKHGWEDLTLDTIEPKYAEVQKTRLPDGDVLSDSSSSTSELPYPTRGLMSSPLKAPLFSDAIGSSNGSTGHRKRTYMASFDMAMSSPTKRYRSSPTAHRSFNGHTSLKAQRQLIQSSPIKPRRQQHFTTSTGPDVSFFQGTRRVSVDLASPNFAAPPSDDEDDLLPTHSFQVNHSRSSPPSTPPMRNRPVNRRSKGKTDDSKEEGADLLLYLAASPSPAVRSSKTMMEPPSTPPPKRDLALPSSMMTTPGGGSNLLFPATPGQPFDFSDFVNITPSPAQKPWKTPVALTTAKTPLTVARRRLTFEEPYHGLV
ncbi:hypothetical protein JX265_008872 [Neoarthrinium moseri]|uniref:Uncharacterized protein n=1 Tax=Neoarthrinium moseri TaxID=1658444 RepID=A0A9P9WHP8_9PEZI|nr:uncharacterized protein JN550_009588 [Neoarthrinium moseri]KAI1848348.1 hypothetical protein JX266_005654 [Neoarthrinium moseri]KAI1863477.1 hypothetical protein JN550_009588 [Neoarthrinium moseri]KAI1863655.1 hypothetical protein JX265_008872 [Neoarthrinium moseri]